MRQVPDVVVINGDATANAATCLMQEICYCGVQPCDSSDRGRSKRDPGKLIGRCWNHGEIHGVKTIVYPVVNVQKTMERSTIVNGKIHYNWPFSIAILTQPEGNRMVMAGWWFQTLLENFHNIYMGCHPSH